MLSCNISVWVIINSLILIGSGTEPDIKISSALILKNCWPSILIFLRCEKGSNDKTTPLTKTANSSLSLSIINWYSFSVFWMKPSISCVNPSSAGNDVKVSSSYVIA